MNACGFSWRQTTVAKTEAADRPVLFTEVVALSRILERDLHTFLSDRTELDDLIDEFGREAEQAREKVRAAEEAFKSAQIDQEWVAIQEGVALAINEYMYTGDSGLLRRSMDIFSDAPYFRVDACIKVLNVVGVPTRAANEADATALREAALVVHRTGQVSREEYLYGFKRDEFIEQAGQFLAGELLPAHFVPLLKHDQVYRHYAGQLIVDLVVEYVELRRG